ncbi:MULTISPECIES: DUF433 domain-containing protein [unclassified Duganella]|uniref:DUF433 domain-containing protein n=1 Tax=unclassified Duganella TaxID=2636909 RepID=UPI000E34E04C|nr:MULTISPECIES: DUF433 domain-containing protein [unclassified Duganella]RFP08475.1 DUF433 domain-containing protein [Duganella sp. BJB475]RFP22683.1 DUF433 domain-containing protein [Duganella sp. BJB476]
MTLDLHERITVDKAQCGGRACIRHLRIRVCDILSLLAAGESHEQILIDYPFLEKNDIYAALAYAADLMEKTTVA